MSHDIPWHDRIYNIKFIPNNTIVVIPSMAILTSLKNNSFEIC